MDVKIIQELKVYSYRDIYNLLGVEDDKATNIIKSLLSMNILKKITSSVDKMELEMLYDVELLQEVDKNINDVVYYFKYVGVLFVGSTCFFIYPKYIEDIEEDVSKGYKKFKQILSVIRKYKSKEQKQDISGVEEDVAFNIIPFTLDILKSYYENGLYRDEKMIVEDNGFGEILWEKTINEKNIFFSEETPFYLDSYTMNNMINSENIFERLHKIVITECCEKTKTILEFLGIPPIMLTDERISDFDNTEYIKYLTENELRRQFVTSRQEILYKILLYIDRKKYRNGCEEISFVGTTNFNLVWEDVCTTMYNDCLNKTLSELKLQSNGNIKRNETLLKVISKPRWMHKKSGKIHEVNKTLVPDIVTIKDGKIQIYDAKYYKIILNDSEIRNYPGVADVTKQYLYELAYSDFAKENNLKIDKNAFLMPFDGKKEENIGSVSLDIFSSNTKEFNDIDIILVPCESAFEKYIKVW